MMHVAAHTPAAGSILINAYKPTSTTDTTPTAATTTAFQIRDLWTGIDMVSR